VLQAPQLLTAEHVLGEFDSGVPSLDDWLRRRAMLNQAKGASRTYVLSDTGRVVAFYALAASAVAGGAAPGRFKRNMPDPIPVVVLGRLAIARSHQGRGLGRALFQDAAQRVVHASDAIGIRGLLVHAISDEAKSFYLSLGLTSSPIEPMTLMATIDDLRGNAA
jgi:GNAT superfamily N-acetyltransferase